MINILINFNLFFLFHYRWALQDFNDNPFRPVLLNLMTSTENAIQVEKKLYLLLWEIFFAHLVVQFQAHLKIIVDSVNVILTHWIFSIKHLNLNYIAVGYKIKFFLRRNYLKIFRVKTKTCAICLQVFYIFNIQIGTHKWQPKKYIRRNNVALCLRISLLWGQ